MKNHFSKEILTIILVIMAISSACIFFSSCKNEPMDGKIIITRVSGKLQNENYITGDSWRYIPKTQIAVLDPNNGEASLKVLTSDFYSAQSPEISYDGKYMLFAGQLKENDHWQIWEIELEKLRTKQITSSNENCTDPVYLPNGRIVYSKSEVNDSLKAGHSLFTCNLDGSENKRITFNPAAYFASNVLIDGRVLTVGRQLYPQVGEQMFMVLRPDGTKAEMFYNGISESNLITNGRETSDGKIVFIESVNGEPNSGSLVSISYKQPLHSRIGLSEEIKGDFRSVFPERSGKLLVSYRKSDSDRYALYEFDAKRKVFGNPIYSNKEFDVLDAIVIGGKVVPKKLPSEVDMGVKTGLLLCQNINVTDIQPSASKSSNSESSVIEVLGLNSSLGKVQVEEDGSFYLKVLADMPFRIQTIDSEGNVVRGPGSWIWLRPNERRGCIGCHEDRELVPQNNVPLSVKKSPVIIPVNINKLVEKNVLLE